MKRRSGMPAFAAALALTALSACAPEVPATPTYSKDVQAIFMARCTRCHGETLQNEKLGSGSSSLVPGVCHLNRYESTGDCSDAGIQAGMCSLGAGLCIAKYGAVFKAKVIPATGTPTMPPDPAPKLDDWQRDVVTAWVGKVDAMGLPAP